jgi:hypothetical protein
MQEPVQEAGKGPSGSTPDQLSRTGRTACMPEGSNPGAAALWSAWFTDPPSSTNPRWSYELETTKPSRTLTSQALPGGSKPAVAVLRRICGLLDQLPLAVVSRPLEQLPRAFAPDTGWHRSQPLNEGDDIYTASGDFVGTEINRHGSSREVARCFGPSGEYLVVLRRPLSMEVRTWQHSKLYRNSYCLQPASPKRHNLSRSGTRPIHSCCRGERDFCSGDNAELSTR